MTVTSGTNYGKPTRLLAVIAVVLFLSVSAATISSDQSNAASDDQSSTNGSIIDLGALDNLSRTGTYGSETECYSEIHIVADENTEGQYTIYVLKGSWIDIDLSTCSWSDTAWTHGPEITAENTFHFTGYIEEYFYYYGINLDSSAKYPGPTSLVINVIDAGNTVTFDHSALESLGGDISDLTESITVPFDESLQLPDFGTVGDFTHAGWYIDGVFYEPGATYTPTGNITIQSAWLLPSVTITMYVEDNIYATLAVPKGSSGVIFTPVDVSGIFTGWFYDPSFQDEYDPVAPINDDLNLYAKGVPPLTFTTDPVADGDIVALEGQPGTVSFRATDSLYYSSVLWDFGDGTTSTDLYATHYYSEPGTYTASLTVYNNHGSDVTTYRIEVPSADPDDDVIEWALVAAVVLIAFVSGALIARRLL